LCRGRPDIELKHHKKLLTAFDTKEKQATGKSTARVDAKEEK